MEGEKIAIGKRQTAVAGTRGAVDETGLGAMQPDAIAGPFINLVQFVGIVDGQGAGTVTLMKLVTRNKPRNAVDSDGRFLVSFATLFKARKADTGVEIVDFLELSPIIFIDDQPRSGNIHIQDYSLLAAKL